MKKSKFKQAITLIFVLSALIFVSGCKSKKTLGTSGTLEKKSHNEVIEDVLKAEVKYKTISTKGSIEFKLGGSGKKATTVFTIVKDEVIQASIRPIFGVEAIRVIFTPDSIIVIDRLKKQYVAERFRDSEIMANFDFNFSNLQALLTNQLFVPGKQEVLTKDYARFNISATPDVYLLKTKDNSDLLYNFAVDASNRLVSTLIYSEMKNVTLQWSYSDFINDDKFVYPTNMAAKVDIAKKRVDINISYSKLEFDKIIEVDRSIPKRYTEVSFMDLIRSY